MVTLAQSWNKQLFQASARRTWSLRRQNQFQLALASPENAAKIVEGAKDDARLAEKATLIALGRVLLNLDEFVTRD